MQLSRALASGDFDQPRIGQHLGRCFLPESGEKLLIWNVYLIGTIAIRGHLHVVGAIPGRDDLFLGRWWSSPVGPRLWRLEGMSLAAPLPLEPGPGKWGKDPEIRASLGGVCEEIAEGMAPSGSSEPEAIAAARKGYQEGVAWMCDRLLVNLAKSGFRLSMLEVARAIDPEWDVHELLHPAHPGVLHAIGMSLATVRHFGFHAEEDEGVAAGLLQTAWFLETGTTVLGQEASLNLLRGSARTLATLVPDWQSDGPACDWARLREKDPTLGILPALRRSSGASLARSLRGSQGAKAAVVGGPPTPAGLVRRGGHVDDRDRWKDYAFKR